MSEPGRVEPSEPARVEPTNAQQDQPTAGNGNANKQWFDLKASPWTTVALTVVLIGIGSLQTCIYNQEATMIGQQTAIMGQQATISQRQLGIMAAEQRPWISVEDAGIIVPLCGNPEESISTRSCPLKITAIRPQFTFGLEWRHWFGVRS